MATPQLIDLMTTFKVLKNESEQYEDKLSKIKLEICKFLAENQANILLGDNNKPLATWNESSGRKTLDAEKLKTFYSSTYEACLKQGKPYRTLLIK